MAVIKVPKEYQQTLPDYSVFKTSKEEKAKAYTIKKRWERTMRMFYGKQWKKYNNYPSTLTND